MGTEHSHQNHHKAGGHDFEPISHNKEDLRKFQKEVPMHTYARLASERPKLLPEVEDTIKQHKPNAKISGSSSGSKLPTYELLKSPGVYYEGEWKNRQQNGRGIARGSNGTYLDAYFVNGKAEGNGLHIYPDGSYYTGEFKNGAFNGKGKFFYKLNGMTYEGEWKDGKPDGKGVEVFPGIGKYEGYFKNGLKHGKGEMKWADGRQYEGEFSDGYMHGMGELKKDKGYYKGKFERNNKVQGIMKTEFGTYDGSFVRGEMSGRGKFTWNNGNVYEGEFKFNKMHGNGTMKLKNNQTYTGTWENGVNVKINE